MKDRKPGSASPGEWGFGGHPAPPPPQLLVDVSAQTPLTGCAWVKQGLGPFPELVGGTWSCWTQR